MYTMENNILKQKLINNRLLYTPIVVPDILKDCLLILAHNKQGHKGFRRTYASLKNRYHWKGMKKSVHQKFTPIYSPQCNGRIEGFHKFLKARIAKQLETRIKWDDLVWKATAAYNFFPQNLQE